MEITFSQQFSKATPRRRSKDGVLSQGPTEEKGRKVTPSLSIPELHFMREAGSLSG